MRLGAGEDETVDTYLETRKTRDAPSGRDQRKDGSLTGGKWYPSPRRAKPELRAEFPMGPHVSQWDCNNWGV